MADTGWPGMAAYTQARQDAARLRAAALVARYAQEGTRTAPTPPARPSWLPAPTQAATSPHAPAQHACHAECHAPTGLPRDVPMPPTTDFPPHLLEDDL